MAVVLVLVVVSFLWPPPRKGLLEVHLRGKVPRLVGSCFEVIAEACVLRRGHSSCARSASQVELEHKSQ